MIKDMFMHNIKISVVFIILIASAVAVQAANKTWDGGGADDRWLTAANWDLDALPASGDLVYLSEPSGLILIEAGDTVACTKILGPSRSACTTTFTITDGNLTNPSYWKVASAAGGTGIVNIQGDAKVVTRDLLLGAGGGTAIVNMTGGTLNITGTTSTTGLIMPYDGTSSGTINISGGVLITGSLNMANASTSSPALIDIGTNGTLRILGDVRTAVEGYISNGYITANSGSATVVILYDGTDTILQSSLNPNPAVTVTLPAIISDNMVLQSDSNVPIWGVADTNSRVTVSCSWSDANQSVDTNSAGKWSVIIRTPTSGTNCSIRISCGYGTKEIKNILIGQVWLCSGQSNMWLPVSQANNADAEIAAANYPDIRLFTVKENYSQTPLDDCSGQWVVCNSQNVADFSAAGYFFGRELYQNIHKPIGLINSSYGGTPAQSWTRREILAGDELLNIYLEKDAEAEANRDLIQQQYDEALAQWEIEAAAAEAAGEEPPEKPEMPRELYQKNKSSVLYNAMIHPLIPFTIKGVIWYQGETNKGDVLYKRLFPALIANWRQDWAQGNFPFYYVQLASYGRYMAKDANGIPDLTIITDSNWALIRDAQLKTLSSPNTGMAVAIDIGDISNIHPTNKQDVGKRLALWALAKDYGFNDVVYSGPLYKSMRIENNKIYVSFDYVSSGLTVHGSGIKGFTIAGEDEKFYPASAAIQGDEVAVWASQVSQPAAVRYGWSDWSNCNIYNEELPASPFRTDNWYFNYIGLWPSRCMTEYVSDLNGDCRVDFEDLSLMLTQWLNDGRD